MCPARQAPPARPAVEEWVPASPRSPGTAALTPGPPLTLAPSGASGFFLHWGFLPAANSLCVSWFWVWGERPGLGCCRAPDPPLPGGGPQAFLLLPSDPQDSPWPSCVQSISTVLGAVPSLMGHPIKRGLQGDQGQRGMHGTCGTCCADSWILLIHLSRDFTNPESSKFS